ncbi:hypothetical protein V5O48_012692 [Marasmius crinis-equi]|uniref:Uncharacterized protein n=1 Tax=Marasmius crinis-equi TaxID=585013 RepID=A0ABR3F2C8_9AGAR
MSHHLMPVRDKELHLKGTVNWSLPFILATHILERQYSKALKSLNVNVVFGERLDVDAASGNHLKPNKRGQRVVRISKSRRGLWSLGSVGCECVVASLLFLLSPLPLYTTSLYTHTPAYHQTHVEANPYTCGTVSVYESPPDFGDTAFLNDRNSQGDLILRHGPIRPRLRILSTAPMSTFSQRALRGAQIHYTFNVVFGLALHFIDVKANLDATRQELQRFPTPHPRLLDDEQMAMIPEDEDEQHVYSRYGPSCTDLPLTIEQFLADLEVLVPNDLVDDMAVLLNKSKDNARTQDTRDLK